ncbi:DNA polymerase/3'-5' exonuclease PolX [Thermoanaerobacterium sp. DL9XJH110]|uniref:DNA polymerase/3'-5' exonuclease PolX n=1 Tax=Thermoanaerobacterium sp. DL9XJH110 TaxID=3386643 RepID=UPI003BB6DDC5
MRNFQVSFILSDIADMLEIKGENFFKVRAYRKAAHVIENLAVEVEDLMRETPLESIEGIGKAIAGKITEIVNTGTCRYYEELKENFPRGLVEMLKIPGLGARKVKTIYDALNISSIDELEKAARSHKLRNLPGMGVKTEQAILKGIQMVRGGAGKMLLPTALSLAEDLISKLSGMPEVEKIEAAGSLRRRKEMIGDIDLIIASTYPEDVVEGFLKIPTIAEVTAKGSAKVSVRLDMGIQVDLRIVEPKSFYPALQYFTGSKEHNTKLRSISQEMGFKLNEYGIFEPAFDRAIFPESEEELYKQFGMPYIIPELREDRGEIEAAMTGRLPEVIDLKDIKGDLHVHSDWSDGVNSIESIALAARAMGYEYIAITDHSKSLKVARGLDEKRLKEQMELIKKLNQSIEGFRILTGIEVDILSDEILDFDDEILKELDVVVASIHSGFKQDREKLTRRILAACENPHVDIIAHPTGRMLGKRDPYDVDLELILKAAAETGTILEINSSPDRLDLNDLMAKRAKEMGVKISIDTDAHEKDGLKDMKYGVWVARRGWLEKKDVINTLPLDELLKELKAK